MRSLNAALVIVTAFIILFCDAANAAPPQGSSGPRRHNDPTLVMVTGVVVKSQVEANSGWVTVVAGSFSRSAKAVENDKNLEPLTLFRLALGRGHEDFPLGHKVQVLCHLTTPPSGVATEAGPDDVVGMVVDPQAGEEYQIGPKPDFDLMTRVLKESPSDEARLLVVEALKTIPGKKSTRTIELAIYDLVESIRLVAAEELVARDYEPGIEKLEAFLLGDVEEELDYQLKLAEVLAQGGRQSGLDFLVRHLNDDDPGRVRSIINVLVLVGGAEEAAALNALAKQTDDGGIAATATKAAAAIESRLEETE